ncbi:MAG: HAD-IIA family hydrolase [Pseudanabaenales cyanobacterium]|nr:HAD-IIA family hydrolase [Pseudanabaenales cyanobacterium]
MERLRAVRHLALDMDGTIHLGERLFPETLPFLELLDELGIGFTFLTNNNSKGREEHLHKLKKLGVRVGSNQLLISTDAAIAHLQASMPGVARLHVLGSPGLRRDFRAAGYQVIDGPDEPPDAVIIGYDTALTYEKLERAARWISAGLPYLATHPDRVCPTDGDTVLPDCGAICALLEAATERAPDAIPGKPSPAMLASLCERDSLAPDQVAMVGDRLYTDMRMAREFGCPAILTLTGETTRERAAAASPRPDIVVANLAELGALLRQANPTK